MPHVDPAHPLSQLLQRDHRYKLDAYLFVLESLAFGQENLGMGAEPPAEELESSAGQSAEAAGRAPGRGRGRPRRRQVERHVSGIGTYPLLGTYDQVVDRMKQFSDAGLDGMAVGLVNYIDEFPILRDEILPRMERVGLRNKHVS
jgi:alkanesulfonate monooxygenase SsuD/methylene tetrahydromethanopterin reductase-like flavin-dependent oxidoreductase (luciferase family)